MATVIINPDFVKMNLDMVSFGSGTEVIFLKRTKKEEN